MAWSQLQWMQPLPLPLEALPLCLCVTQIRFLQQTRHLCWPAASAVTNEPHSTQVRPILFSESFLCHTNTLLPTNQAFTMASCMCYHQETTHHFRTQLHLDTVQCDLCFAVSAESTCNAKSAAYSKA